MYARGAWAFLALCASTVVSQSSPDYQFTMDVTSPAPVPGQPFTITWNGGAATDVVYIVLDYYFGDTPNQNIIYETTDILSNAPNNGSWVYNVPGNIFPGRYSFQIGVNPFLLSGISGIFNITASQTFPVSSAAPATTNTAFQSYNGCGLPPLPDYTYTGYQPRCTTTTNGVVETLYPIVPVSDSSAFFGSGPQAAATVTIPSLTSFSTVISSASLNTAFATGVYAQALQCPNPVTPSQTRLTGSSATTIFSLVGCETAAVTSSRAELFPLGVCHTSGYSTFSVTSGISMCCPSGWATTPLNDDPFSVFCYTSTSVGAVEKRQISTETLAIAPYTLVAIEGLAFTRAGIVENDSDSTGADTLAASQTGSLSVASKGVSTQTVESSTGITTTTTGPVPSATGNDGGARLDVRGGIWGMLGLAGLWGIL